MIAPWAEPVYRARVASYDSAAVIAGDFYRAGYVPEHLRTNQTRTRIPMRLIPKPEGFALTIKVVPGSSQQRIAGEYADGLKVTVTAAPQRGAANDAVIAVLAEALQTAPSNVRIVRGHQNPRKEVLIVGLPAEEIERRLLADR